MCFIAGTRTNHALLKPTTQSTTNQGSHFAVDGNLLTASSTYDSWHSYWTVDLQYDIWMTSVALTNRNNGCKYGLLPSNL